MKPKFEQISNKQQDHSFLCYEVKVPMFTLNWHYHPEYELTYIVKGRGKRLVGDSYEQFKEGDFVLLGSGLPHTWISEKPGKQECVAIVVQFSQAWIDQLLGFPETRILTNLFTRSARGLSFRGNKHKDCLPLLRAMCSSSSIGRFHQFVQLLELLNQAKPSYLASEKYQPMRGDGNQQRINKVFQYVQKEFRNDLSLDKAAALTHLSKSAFCKFFKRASGKTFSDYTNDIRVAHACQLLIETDQTIAAVAYASGFESLTYFNRVFLKKKRIKPGGYRNSARG